MLNDFEIVTKLINYIKMTNFLIKSVDGKKKSCYKSFSGNKIDHNY